jgi:hypothetical protein
MVATKNPKVKSGSARIASNDSTLNNWVYDQLKARGLTQYLSNDQSSERFPGFPQYIRSKLKSADFNGQDLDDLTSKIFIRLLIASEGSQQGVLDSDSRTLFDKYDPKSGVPFDRYFMMAAKNQVVNEINKRAKDQAYADPTKGTSIQPGGRGEGSEMQGISEETLPDTRSNRSVENEEHLRNSVEKFRDFLKAQRNPFLIDIYDYMSQGGTKWRDQVEGAKHFNISTGQMQGYIKDIQRYGRLFVQGHMDEGVNNLMQYMDNRENKRNEADSLVELEKAKAKMNKQVYVPTDRARTWMVNSPAKFFSSSEDKKGTMIPTEKLRELYGTTVPVTIKNSNNLTHHMIIQDGPNKKTILVVPVKDLQ